MNMNLYMKNNLNVNDPNLNDILITPLKQIPTDGGDVLHVLKKKDYGFNGFGEVYFSWIKQGSIKTWRCHKSMTANLVVPLGEVRFVFFLPKEKNIFRIEIIGEERYVRITVPPGIWFAFQGKAKQKSLLMNLADIEHNHDEVLKKPINSINFNWEK